MQSKKPILKYHAASRQKGKTSLPVKYLLLGFSLVVLLAILLLNLEEGTQNSTAPVTQPPTSLSTEETATDKEIAQIEEGIKLETLKNIDKMSYKKTHLPIEHWTSPNGAQIYFMRVPEIPMVDVRLHFYAGSSRDGDIPGTAKLTNAMLGEGSKEHNVDEITAGFESLGAKFVVESVRDVAVAQLRSLTDPAYLNPALDLFAEVIGKPSFPEDNFKRNINLMQVALKEQEQQPSVLISNRFFSTLFKQHPYQNPPQGTKESIEKINIDIMKNFYDTYYVTQNLIMAIVGNITKSQAEEIARASTQFLKRGQKVTKLPPTLPTHADHIHIQFPSQQTHLFIGSLAIPNGHPDFIALSVGNEVLGGGGFNSILNQVIRQDRGLSYSVSSTFAPMLSSGGFYINLQTKNASAKEALQITLDILRNFIEKGPSDAQLQKAKENIIGGHALRTATNTSIASNLGIIGFYELPITYVDDFTEKVTQVTKEEIQKAFQNIIDMNRLVIVTLGPEALNQSLGVTPEQDVKKE